MQHEKEHIHSWTNAAGANKMLAAAVVSASSMVAELMPLPEVLAEATDAEGWQLHRLPGVRSISLRTNSLKEVLSGNLCPLWVDNQGVLHSLVRGSSLAEDMNVLIGRMWLQLSSLQIDLSVQRVESKANVADGPTRCDFSKIAKLGAQFHAPRWPAWASDVWDS